jgi:prepilin-type N-terminal cleavage/methylation domain-containing protein
VGIAEPQSRGFTLIEVIVALLVSALLLTSIFGALSLARTRDKQASDQQFAMLHARALLDARVDAPFSAAADRSRARGLEFETRETAIGEDPRRFFVLSKIEVEVRRAKGDLLYRAALRHIKASPPT